MVLNTVIKGTGHFLPNKVVKNSDFLNAEFYDQNGILLESTNEEIIRKFFEITEIEERRYVDGNMKNSDLAVISADLAIKDWGGDKEDLDYVIFAHNFGDITEKGNVDIMPSLSARLKNKLGIRNRKCRTYDMIFGCPGWLESMILAHQLIQSKVAKNILVVASEILSRSVDIFDRDRMIFSDGTAAVVVCGEENNEKRGVLSYSTICDNGEEINYLHSGESINKNCERNELHIRMQGRKIYEYALTNVPLAIKETIDSSGLALKDLKKLLIHQANSKMDDAILKRLVRLYSMKLEDLPFDFMPMTISKFGNSSVSTIPTMLDLILKNKLDPHKIEKGDNLVFASVGAGMNINSIVYRF